MVLLSCASVDAPSQTAARAGAASSPETTAGSADPTDPISRALAAALARDAWPDLRIEAECRNDAAHLRSVALYGEGVGIWERERQFAVAPETLRALLGELARANFGAFRESYGGPDDPEEGDAPRYGLQMVCRVRVVLDGIEKQSFQLSEGRRSVALKELAEKILEQGAREGPAGLGADSLSDGLEKLARGALAPEALILQLQRLPEDPKASDGGWLLRLEHGDAEVSFSSAEGWSEPSRVPLAREDIAALAGRLAEAHPEDLPVNLYSTWYQDLEIRVLNRKVTLQARRFAGLTPETHGEKQERFDAMIEAIEGVKRRVEEKR